MEFSELITTPKVDGATLYRANQSPIEGTLCITPFYLILSSRSKDPPEELWLLHKSVDCVERKSFSEILTLKCKDFQILKLGLPDVETCSQVSNSLEALSNLDDETLSYPFHNHLSIEVVEDGWQIHSIATEFNRMKSYIGAEWRLSAVNEDFKVCPSYPSHLIVLKNITDAMITTAATYRSKGRFPVLAYYHKQNGMVLIRCSQPMSRGGTRRNKEDERMVNGILNGGGKGGDGGGEKVVGVDGSQRMRGYIVDTRSPGAVKIDTARGGGTETEQFYPLWRRVTHPIDQPPSLQDSLVKLIEACLDAGCSTDKWLSRLEASNWLSSVGDALFCSQSVARYLDDGGSVMVRGGGGMDTTLIVTSLSQVLLNPDSRTLVGFEALVEREWIQAGHPFSNRCVKGAFSTSKRKTEAPTFLLFLDCVYQIWQQFSCSFEFNTFFISSLFKHAYASQFGTFLFNNERERDFNKVRERTISLWSYINSPSVMPAYMNPLYTPNPSVLHPSTAPHSLQLWTQVYQGWQRSIPRKEGLWGVMEGVIEAHKTLKAEVIKMRKYVVKLEKESLKQNLLPQ